jgi:hypothetical protein
VVAQRRRHGSTSALRHHYTPQNLPGTPVQVVELLAKVSRV